MGSVQLGETLPERYQQAVDNKMRLSTACWVFSTTAAQLVGDDLFTRHLPQLAWRWAQTGAAVANSEPQ